MSLETTKTITDQRQIAGYLRDAIFNRNFFAVFAAGNDFRVSLATITETSARDRTGERFLIFDLHPDHASDHIKNKVGEKLEFCVAFDRLMMRFESSLSEVTSTGFRTNLPNEVSITIARKTYRFNSAHLSRKNCSVIITSETSETIFGTLELKDISSSGFGGILSVSNTELPKGQLHIKGKLLQEVGAIEINGELSRAVRDVSTPRRTSFQVGIKNKIEINKLADRNSDDSNRRTLPRLSGDLPIEVTSPLFPKSPAILQLENLSLSGIRARFLSLADSDLFRPGLEVILKTPHLRLRVQNVTRQHITFKVLKSALEEHIRLFNHQSLLTHTDLAAGTPISSDLTQVYTTSGAFSTSIAERLSSNRDYLSQASTRSDADVPWNLRWLQQAEDGRIRAAFLSAPFSDHIWYVGGLAGHMDSDLKMGSDFVNRFFEGMGDFFRSLDSKEHFIINWFKTNSWWEGWESWLSQQEPSVDFFRFDGDIAYIQDLSKLGTDASAIPKCTLIPPSDISTIEATLADIFPQSLRRLAESFGLGKEGGGPAATSELLERAGHHFFRSFYKMTLEDCSVVIMISSFPGNVFLNGIINYPFIITTRQLSPTELDKVLFRLCEITAARGLECPAFFLTANGIAHKEKETPTLILKEVIWTYGDEKLLEYWNLR